MTAFVPHGTASSGEPEARKRFDGEVPCDDVPNANATGELACAPRDGPAVTDASPEFALIRFN
jgi:hypothetical protein